jgi:hypothetical protein
MKSWVTEALKVGIPRPDKKQEIHSDKDYQILFECMQKKPPHFHMVWTEYFQTFMQLFSFFLELITIFHKLFGCMFIEFYEAVCLIWLAYHKELSYII